MAYPKSTRGRGAGFGTACSEVVTKASKMKLMMSLIVVVVFFSRQMATYSRNSERERRSDFQKHAELKMRETRREVTAKASNGLHRVVRQLADVLKHMY